MEEFSGENAKFLKVPQIYPGQGYQPQGDVLFSSRLVCLRGL